jgi:uncharacterized protein (TIGR00725 family)
MVPHTQIAVVGAGECDSQVSQLAEEVGEEIGKRGFRLVCGGLGGVMEAACRGAQRAGGLTVAILPSYDRGTANPWVDIVIPTGFGHGRNVIVVASADVVIALPGEHGTASEIALALALRRQVVALGAWTDYPEIVHARSPREAVERASRLALAG